ncbi:type I polyketide synthase [Nocardia mexicana]|uniref:type I polyketide synthase n=1 Tax=Nocardia mexicana TaxID=279262 RepID=UPI001470EC0C|nr:type I polyketide synthase [Nocardia mexicana]
MVGIGCRFPGGIGSPGQLWEFVAAGQHVSSEFPAERPMPEMVGMAEPEIIAAFAPKGGFIEEPGAFDSEFFGISPREARAMDPQQRIALEVCWQSLEHAGIDPHRLRQSRTGIYIGSMAGDYAYLAFGQQDIDPGYIATGMSQSVLSGRISYLLGFEGPAMTVDTACSSSLVAVHLAAQALRGAECTLALAGGVTIMSTLTGFYALGQHGAVSRDGRSKAYSADADGFCVAEGAAMLVLERADDARRHGHRILALLRGSAINQDGASKGLTVPSAAAQTALIESALADADLTAAEVDVVEGHGTGTPVGDPLELEALFAGYGQGRPADSPLLLGSIKSNFGHAQAAAGVAGIVKMIEAIRHGIVPASLHVAERTSSVDWSSGAVEVVTAARPWPEHGRPRRAGISSFGISGTNAHVIVEQAPEPPAALVPVPESTAAEMIWTVSGRSAQALSEQARTLLDHLRAHPELDHGAVAYALATTRAAFEHRAAVIGCAAGDLHEGLAAIAEGRLLGTIHGVAADHRVVFVFPGQGAQYVGMGARLMRESPVFAAHVRACDEAFAQFVDWSVADTLAAVPGTPNPERIDVVQPLLFTTMTAMAALWQSLGVKPDAVLGHSQGEVAAAYVAGVLSLSDAARIVALRSRAIGTLAGTGAMVSVNAPAEQVEEILAGLAGLTVAAVNSPRTTVVSGGLDAVQALLSRCEEQGVRARRIGSDVAGHSSHFDVLRAEVESAVAPVTAHDTEVAIFSTVTGDLLSPLELGPGYWFRNMRETVQFDAGFQAAYQSGYTAFLEMSTHPVLTAAMHESLEHWGAEPEFVVVTGSVDRDDDGLHGFLSALARAHVRGVSPDWPVLFDGYRGGVELPTYAFQYQKYWLTAAGTMLGGKPSGFGLADPGHPLLGAMTELPGADKYTFTTRLSVATHAWMADHALNGNILVPGAMLLELALHVGDSVGCPRVEKLTMYTPITLPERGAVHVQVLAGERNRQGQRTIAVYSRPEADDTAENLWSLHADGLLSVAQETAVDQQGLEIWPPIGAEVAMDPAATYRGLAALGYQYGPIFQGMQAVWRRGEDVFAEVALPESVNDADKYGLHPALLDSALQATAAVAELTAVQGNAIRLPFAWEQVSLYAVGAAALRVRLTPAGTDRVRWLLCDSGGRPIGTGVLQVRTISMTKLAERGLSAQQESLFRIDWLRAPLSRARYSGGSEEWVVVGEHGVADAETLPALHDLDELLTGDGPLPPVVVWSPPGAPGSTRDRLVAVLDRLQRWLADDRCAETTLVLLARGTHAADESEDVTDPAGAAVWGLVRSAQTENPDRIVQIDLDDSAITLDDIATAVASDEPELLWRRGEFCGRRIRTEPESAVGAGKLLQAPWRLDIPSSGNLEDAALAAAEPVGELPAGAVAVDLRAAGISFPVVLAGLDAAHGVPDRVVHEAAGVVTATAPDVTEFAVGDRVFGLFGGIGSAVTTDHRVLARVPEAWSFAEAATAPVAYLTALHALRSAEAKPGQTIMVHCAAGGVGTAAIHLARRLGLEIFATASTAKWDALRSLGIDDDHLGDSRSARFADVFGERGVDIVLNLLPEQLTGAALGLVAPGGRFVEVGRATVLTPEQAGERRGDIGYSSFELGALDPDRLRDMLSELVGCFGRAELPPLPLTRFDVRHAAAALRYTSEALHTGKVVLTWPRAFDPGATVLVTGGTGTIGGLVARHLVTRHGARNLLLASRSGAQAPGVSDLVAELSGEGAHVTVASCDTSDVRALAELLGTIPADHPLGAVVHVAATIADATLPSLTPEHINAVLPAKADGAQYLHELTAHLDLSMFVLFSSAAGTLGSPGQANYGAANVYVDALAQHRYHRGLPATSMAWGWWAETTANTSTLDEKDRARLTRMGITPMSTAAAMQMFDAALHTGRPHLVPIGMNLGLLRAAAAVTELPPLFRALLHTRPRVTQQMGDPGQLAKRLTGLDQQQQHAVVVEMVRTPVSMVLGYSSPADIQPDREFTEMGIDSLSSIELGTHLRALTGLKLPNSVIFQYPTANLLARHILDQLAPEEAGLADPIVAEVEMLLARLAAIHAEAAVPAELIDRLSTSVHRLGNGHAGSAEPVAAEPIEHA